MSHHSAKTSSCHSHAKRLQVVVEPFERLFVRILVLRAHIIIL
jgi:hypothetical protein